MPPQYLYGCNQCQKSFEISEKLAGTTQNCPFCGHPTSLPGMRDIRKLPTANTAAGDTATGRKTRSFSETSSWLFSGGLLVAVTAGLLGIALLIYAQSLSTESRLAEKIAFGNQQIEPLPAGLLWDAWDKMTIDGLPDWKETEDNRYNKQSVYLSYVAYGLFGVALIGAGSVASSLFRGK